MRTRIPLRYHLYIYRREHLWLPAALWALFALLVALMRDDAGQAYNMANAFLGTVLPMLAGILSSSAIVDDQALELQLAAPRAPWRTLLERLALLLALTALAALAFQLYLAVVGVDLSFLGGGLKRQLAWLIPSLGLMGLGTLAALACVQATAGALLAGAVWIAQLLLRGQITQSAWARYLFLFLGSAWPEAPCLLANQLCLVGLAVLCIGAAAWMLKREERYL